jgi:hypothetical protein
MVDFVKKLYDDLESKLQELDSRTDPGALTPDLRLGMIEEAISRIKKKLKDYSFHTEAEEVYFFKVSLPPFLSLLIYYTEKTELECMALIVDARVRKEYFARQMRKINNYCREHAEFLRYYRSAGTSLDKQYFLRNSPFNRENVSSLVDQSFCTVYTVTVATFHAYARLGGEIRNQFPGAGEGIWVAGYTGIKLKWTDTKSSLVELAYSFKEKGSFNNGEADLQSIFGYLEYVFSVHVDNPYRSFQEILCRKKGYTLYLDSLRNGLIRKIDDIENGHKG